MKKIIHVYLHDWSFREDFHLCIVNICHIAAILFSVRKKKKSSVSLMRFPRFPLQDAFKWIFLDSWYEHFFLVVLYHSCNAMCRILFAVTPVLHHYDSIGSCGVMTNWRWCKWAELIPAWFFTALHLVELFASMQSECKMGLILICSRGSLNSVESVESKAFRCLWNTWAYLELFVASSII